MAPRRPRGSAGGGGGGPHLIAAADFGVESCPDDNAAIQPTRIASATGATPEQLKGRVIPASFTSIRKYRRLDIIFSTSCEFSNNDTQAGFLNML